MSYTQGYRAERTVAVSSQSGYTEKRENMSTQVTVHRMVTTSTTSAVLINVGYVKTLPGLLKLFQMVIGCVICGILGHYITFDYRYNYAQVELPLLIIAAAFLIGTSLLFFACLCSISTASIIPKTLFEVMYHITAALLYFSVSVALMVFLEERKRQIYHYTPKMAAAALGLVNCALYILSSFYSVRAFRRG